MFTEITKRNGTKVPFDEGKIIIAMRNAFSQENTSVTDVAAAKVPETIASPKKKFKLHIAENHSANLVNRVTFLQG